MPLIQPSVLMPIMDKIASQYKATNALCNALPTTGNLLSSGNSSYFSAITETEDSDVEITLLDTAFTADQVPDIKVVMTGGLSQYLGIINSCDGHFNRVQFAGSFDNYLATYDFRASNYFNLTYFIAKNQYLLASNVFCDTVSTFGTINIAAGPVVQFIAGINFGIWSPSQKASGSNFAATQLKLVVESFSGAQCDLRITGTDGRNNIIHEDVTVPASAHTGDEILIGTSYFLGVGTVQYINGNKGTAGDQYLIKNIPDRIIP